MTVLAASLPYRPHRGRRLHPWVMVAAAAGGVAAALSALGPAIAFFLALAIGAGLACLWLPPRDREPVVAAYVVALALRLLAMIVLTVAFQSPRNPNGLLYRDSIGYHRVGSDIATLHAQRLPFRTAYHTMGQHLGYHRVIGFLYERLGASHWVGKLSNVVLGALVVIIAFGFARPLAGRWAALATAWMMALWPTAIYWSAQLLKDTLIGLLVILASLLWVRYMTTRRTAYVLLAVLVVLPLYQLRIYIFAFALLALYVAYLVDALARGRVALGVLLAAGAIFGWSVPFALGLADSPQMIVFKLSLANPYSAGSFLTALSGFGVGYVFLLPLALVKFLISPLPWKTVGIERFVVPGIIAQLAILPFAVRGGLLLLRDRARWVLPFVLLTVLTNILYALVFLGGNPRHMHMFYPYLFLCAAAGARGWRHWPVPWILFFALLIAGGVVVLLKSGPLPAE